MILSRAPVEKSTHLQSLLESLVSEHPAKFPSGAPMVSDFRSQALHYPSGSPEKEPFSRFPLQSSPSGALLSLKRHPSPELFTIHSLVIYLSLKVPGKQASLHVPQQGPYRYMFCLHIQWFIRSFISIRVPNLGALPQKRAKHLFTVL